MREPVKRNRFKSANQELEASYYARHRKSLVVPIVVILTGDGSKGSLSSTWSPVIAELLKNNLDVYIFDFQGQGRSEGDRRDLSIEVGRRNFLDALAHLETLLPNKEVRLGLFGSSFGASVILHSLGQVQRQIDCIAFKSPAVDLAAAYECDHGSYDALVGWKEQGLSPVTGIHYSAYDQALQTDLLGHVSLIRCPVLIVHGSADRIVPIHQSWRLANALGNLSTLVELPGVDHGYKEEGAMDSLIQTTARFLSRHLEDQNPEGGR